MGSLVLDFPGGDWEVCRHWTQRDGSHHAVFVLTRGDRMANALRLPSTPLRLHVFPFELGPPFGIDFGLGFYPPLPAALAVQFLPALDWPDLGQRGR